MSLLKITAEVGLQGQLDFTMSANHRNGFNETRAALLKVRAEIDRLLAEQANCPYHNRPPKAPRPAA